MRGIDGVGEVATEEDVDMRVTSIVDHRYRLERAQWWSASSTLCNTKPWGRATETCLHPCPAVQDGGENAPTLHRSGLEGGGEGMYIAS